MKERRCSRALLVAMAFAMCVPTGCTYLRYRGQDAMEMFDLGVTYTEEPHLGLYANCLDILPLGYSRVDGRFLGLGGGRFGTTRHHNRCWGVGYGYQEVGWGDYDVDDPGTLYVHHAGIAGLLFGPPRHDPGYTAACAHFMPHLGYVGLVWNARYVEMLDFLLGWSTFDLAGDDGVKIGRWFWNKGG